jgi:hypothetical protein
MTTFTTADGQAAAEQLAVEQQSIVESLINLEDHLGRKLLDTTALEGVSCERRAEVLDGFATLWDRYERYRTAAVRVCAIMARSRPTPADLHEVEELVTGAAELVADIHVIYGPIHEVVTATNEVWTAMVPRIDACDDLLRQAQTLTATLGLAARQDPVAGLLNELADRLHTVRRIALTDPLQFWVDGAVVVDDVDQLISACDQVRADLHALTELRQHGPGRLDRVNTTVSELRRLHEDTAEERRRVNAKVLAASGKAVSVKESVKESAREGKVLPTELLGLRLTEALELYRCGHWQRLATELPALERAVAAALQRAQAELIEAGGPLRERAELRGRLDAYRAKAAGLGRIEDLALEQRYQRARTLLWCAPCDLAAAAIAVARYQAAVNATATDGDLP